MAVATPFCPPTSIRCLTVVADPEGFLFYDADQPTINPVALQMDAPIDFPHEFEQFVQQSGWSNHPSMRVNLSEHTNRFMIMPAGMDDPEQQRQLFDAAFIKGEAAELYQFPLSDGKQVYVCELSQRRMDCYKGLFKHLHLYNPTHLMTEWIIQQAKVCQESILLAYCYGKSLHVMAANPSQLLFINAFETTSVQDSTYFCLRVIEQLQLNPLSMYAFICTPESKEHPLKEALTPYLERVDQLVYTGLPEVPVCSFYP